MAKQTITLLPLMIVVAVIFTARTCRASSEYTYVDEQCQLTPKPQQCLKIVQSSADQIRESYYELVRVALFNSVGIVKETETSFKRVVRESLFTDTQKAVETCGDSAEAAGTHLDSAALALAKIAPTVTREDLIGPLGQKVTAEINLAATNIGTCLPLLNKTEASKLQGQKNFLNDSVDTIEILKSLMSP